MKQNPHKKTFHRMVPKAAFAMAGGIILAMMISACQFDPQPASSAAGSSSHMTQSVSSSEPLPSLVLSSDSLSSALVSQPPSEPSVPPSSQTPSSAVSSKPAAASAVPSQPASSAPSSAVVSSKPTSKPPSNASDRVFDDAVFVGNSLMEDLYTYGGAGNADFYYRVGLTVRTVFTKPTAKGSVPVIDELKGKSYGKVLLMFGENELGWSAGSAFVTDYGKVIDAVRQRQPDATIYVQSIFPVTKAVSDRNENQVNNARIREYNNQLKQLAAQKGAVYLDVASALQDANGNLPNHAASDGVHPNRNYCMKWLDYLRQNL